MSLRMQECYLYLLYFRSAYGLAVFLGLLFASLFLTFVSYFLSTNMKSLVFILFFFCN